jgi:negative regulator of flagellin synthesis FlgM
MQIFGADKNYNQQRIDDVRKRDQAVETKNQARQGAQETVKSGGGKTETTVALSGMAREVGKASAQVKNTPDIRKEKIEAIKEKIASGQYHVSSDKLAGKIIEDIVRQGK